MQLATLGHMSTYAADITEIVYPDNVGILRPRSTPSLPLVTCYPIYFVGDAPQCSIVHAALKGQSEVGKLQGGSPTERAAQSDTKEKRKMTTNHTIRGVLPGFCTLTLAFALAVVTATAQTSTTTTTKGATTTSTKQESGTVSYVDGNTLVIKMSTGEIRTVTVPDTRTAMIDGKETTVHDLKVGTTLNATYTTTTTPITDRTVTNLTGTVWYVAGNNVIVTLPDGKNKQFKVRPEVRFQIEGNNKATVFDLRKGMRVSAEKIVEEPRTEVASNTAVTGHAPPPPKAVVAAAAPAPTPAPVRAAAAPAPAPAAAPEPAPEPAPATLPKTGSPLPLAGLLGLLCTGAGLALRPFRRS